MVDLRCSSIASIPTTDVTGISDDRRGVYRNDGDDGDGGAGDPARKPSQSVRWIDVGEVDDGSPTSRRPLRGAQNAEGRRTGGQWIVSQTENRRTVGSVRLRRRCRRQDSRHRGIPPTRASAVAFSAAFAFAATLALIWAPRSEAGAATSESRHIKKNVAAAVSGPRNSERELIVLKSSSSTLANHDDSCDVECCKSLTTFVHPEQASGNDKDGSPKDAAYVLRPRLRGIAEPMVPDVRFLQETQQTNNASIAGNPCQEEEEGGAVGLPPALQYLLIVILISFSALFSGLTLGLMSLDPSGLQVVMANADDPKMARAAKTVYPVRLNGNLLLCTLLLGNVAVNSLLSILMADLTSGLVGFLVSTAVIVIFGEIIPQAACSRYALQIGEKTIPVIKVIIALFYVAAKPLSFVLDKILGHEIGTTYSTSEMAKLIEMHVQQGRFEADAGAAMTGALRYRGVAVSEAMTPLPNTFMLGADERLGFDTVAKIFKTGYSRIPVYEVSVNNVIGLLFVKDLIFIDPEDEIPVKNFAQIFGRGLHVVWSDDKLGEVLKLLKQGRSHMALVRGINEGDGTLDPCYEIRGIITLEDIIEIILGDEIVDETDKLVDVNNPNSKVQRSERGDYIEGATSTAADGDDEEPEIVGGSWSDRGVDWEARLRLLDERLVDERLSPDEVRAVSAHLRTNYSRAVELISGRQLHALLSIVPVTDISPALTCATGGGGFFSEPVDNDVDYLQGVPTDRAELLYERGKPAEFCTVVLLGKIAVVSGADRFRSDVSNWGVLAARALTDTSYIPDFTAWVISSSSGAGGCRCVKLDRRSYADAVDNTALERNDRLPGIMVPKVTENSEEIDAEKAKVNEATDQHLFETGNTPRHPSTNDILPASELAKSVISSKGESDKLSMAEPTPPVMSQLPHTQPTPGDSLCAATPSYVRTKNQAVKQSRRGRLLKAFRGTASKSTLNISTKKRTQVKGITPQSQRALHGD